MIAEALIAGGSLGLLSSFHCVGMCGPLSLALPVAKLSPARQNASILLYNLGRVATYAGLGLLFGLAGRRLYVAGWQQAFSIVSGLFVLFLALQYFLWNREWQPRWLASFHRLVQQWMGYFLRSKSTGAFFLLGMANGLLPCGMVYLAIAGALSSSSVGTSILFMASFGMGTLPAMLALHFLGWRVNLAVRRRMNKALPYLMGVIALVLILRGLNLGIPFISPVLAHSSGAAAACH